MNHHARPWGLPLLVKELTELAARPRTFQTRVIYAVLLLLISDIVLVTNIPGNQLFLSSLGAGRHVLTALCFLQTLGLYLTLPVLACSTLTVERERQTLDLLLITRLGPWTIIFEKFFGQLIPALNLIALSLPILAFSYALGGISPEHLSISMLELFLTAVRIIAVGVMCSAMFRTTNYALMATYVGIVMTCFFEQTLLYQLLPLVNQFLPPGRVGFSMPPLIDLLFVDPGLPVLLRSNLALVDTADVPIWWQLGFGMGSSVLWSLFCLALARLFAVPPATGWLSSLFRFRASAGRRIRSISQERAELTDAPIAWREAPRGSLVYWWAWNALIATVATSSLLILAALNVRYVDLRFVTPFVYFPLWIASMIRLCSFTSTLIVLERTNQTLDVLRCTLLSGRVILQQKLRHAWRLVHLSQLVLFTCVVFHTLMFPSVIYFLGSALMIWQVPQLVLWQSLRCGLTARTGVSAIFNSMLTNIAWCLLPLLLCLGIAIAGGRNTLPVLATIASASPLGLLGMTESFPEINYRGQTGFDPEHFGYFCLMFTFTFLVQGVRIVTLIDWVYTNGEARLANPAAKPDSLAF